MNTPQKLDELVQSYRPPKTAWSGPPQAPIQQHAPVHKKTPWWKQRPNISILGHSEHR